MERRLPVVENEGYDVVLSEHIADLLGWEREDILKKIDALIREYDLDSQFDSRGNHVVYFFEDTVADYEENIPLEDPCISPRLLGHGPWLRTDRQRACR